MSATEDIKKAIKELSKTNDAIYSVVCEVSNVSEVDMTCDCTPLDGSAELLEVRLQAQLEDGWVLVPKEGSVVTVTMLNQTTGFVSQVSEIDKIIGYINAGNKFEFSSDGFVWNDGTNGGLIKLPVLITQLNTLSTRDLTLKTAITALMAGYAPIDGGVALAAFNAVVLPPIVTNTMENTKIKH